MYQITVDGKLIHDSNIDYENYVVLNPKCHLKVNAVDSASFDVTIKNPMYDSLQKLKSVIEIFQDDAVIFRGRIIDDEKDFYNTKNIDAEGALGYFNDSIVRPFNFPEDYPESINADNIVEFFLNELIKNHNSQVQDFQKFKLGRVTVSDSNNYIARSSVEYKKTWEILKEKLFESTLGGYFCIRYESDGNYIDYLSEFTEINSQQIEIGKNLLDLTEKTDASSICTAIIPIGAEIEQTINGQTIKKDLTIESLGDGKITDDIVKCGDTLYSESGVETYGWIYAPVSETTWDDVTVEKNLLNKAASYLESDALKLLNSLTVKAIDLNFTNDQIEKFQIKQNVIVRSPMHGIIVEKYPLTDMNIDLMNPQNTTISIGRTTKSITEINAKRQSDIDKVIDKRISVIQNQLNDVAFATFVPTPILTAEGGYMLTSEGKYLLFKE